MSFLRWLTGLSFMGLRPEADAETDRVLRDAVRLCRTDGGGMDPHQLVTRAANTAAEARRTLDVLAAAHGDPGSWDRLIGDAWRAEKGGMAAFLAKGLSGNGEHCEAEDDC